MILHLAVVLLLQATPSLDPRLEFTAIMPQGVPDPAPWPGTSFGAPLTTQGGTGAEEKPSVTYLRELGICPAYQPCNAVLRIALEQSRPANGDAVERFIIATPTVRRECLVYAKFVGTPDSVRMKYQYLVYELGEAGWAAVTDPTRLEHLKAFARPLHDVVFKQLQAEQEPPPKTDPEPK